MKKKIILKNGEKIYQINFSNGKRICQNKVKFPKHSHSGAKLIIAHSSSQAIFKLKYHYTQCVTIHSVAEIDIDNYSGSGGVRNRK